MLVIFIGTTDDWSNKWNCLLTFVSLYHQYNITKFDQRIFNQLVSSWNSNRRTCLSTPERCRCLQVIRFSVGIYIQSVVSRVYTDRHSTIGKHLSYFHSVLGRKWRIVLLVRLIGLSYGKWIVLVIPPIFKLLLIFVSICLDVLQ